MDSEVLAETLMKSQLTRQSNLWQKNLPDHSMSLRDTMASNHDGKITTKQQDCIKHDGQLNETMHDTYGDLQSHKNNEARMSYTITTSTQTLAHNNTKSVDDGPYMIHVGVDALANTILAPSANSQLAGKEGGEKLKALSVEGVTQGKSTFFQATLNCVSMLYGLGILSSPFAIAQAGWAGAAVSLAVSGSYAYAAYLMARCVEHVRRSKGDDAGTYQEVGAAALGRRARHLITSLFYIEITGTLVGYCISMADNLAYLFPNALHSFHLLPGLSGRNLMMFLASLIILPTVWLRDLSALSFTSLWCIASSLCLLLAVLLAATVNHIGFSHPIPLLRAPGIPVAAGLYAFSYGGTSVFPSIYSSMRDPSKFSTVVVLSFIIATSSMLGLGIIGAYMFGEHTASQVTLSMPIHLITTKIILWMTVLTPMFKFALQLSPITTALEARLYKRYSKAPKTMLFGMGTLIRSMALAFIVIFAMVFPYFEYIVALVGSSMTICICMIFPCVFYLKFYWNQLKVRSIVMIISLVVIGTIVGLWGTIVSIQGLITKRSSST